MQQIIISNSEGFLPMYVVKRAFHSIFALSAVAMAVSAYAQDVQDVKNVQKSQSTSGAVEVIKVRGNWLNKADAKQVQGHDGARNVIRAEDFEASGAINVAQAMRLLPGVQVPENNGTGGGDYSLNIGLRGLGARLTSQATVLLDGVPLANAPYGQPELSLAPVTLGNLAAIDLIKGGSAVRYGPQNIGGVVNFVTQDIPEEVSSSLRLRHSLSTNEGNESGFNGGFSTGGTSDAGHGALLMYNGDHSDGFRQNHQQDIDNLYIKYHVELSEYSHFEGGINYYRADAQLPGPLTQAEYQENPWQSSHSLEQFSGERKAFNGKYVYQNDSTREFELGFFVSDSFREVQQTNGKPNGADASRTRFEVMPRDYQVYGIEPRLSELMFFDGGEHEVSVGYRFMNETSNEKRYRSQGVAGFDPATATAKINRNTDGETNAHALYLDDRIVLGGWDITPGVRMEWINVSRYNLLNDFEDEQSYSEVLPSLAIGYQLNPDLRLYANANSSFGTVGFLSLSTDANSSLEAERAKLYELGGRYQINDLALDMTLFYIDFDNQIQYDANVKENVNIGASRHQGIELRSVYELAQLGLDGFSIDASYAYVDATMANGEFKGNDLRLYSQHQLSITGLYQLDDWRFALQGYAQSRQFADEENTIEGSADGKIGNIPGFSHWNLNITRDLTWGELDTKVSFGLKNMFDKGYFTRASIENNGGIFVGAPRSAYLELSTQF
jgi:Fe(3+) dicitrate transport protein